MKGGAATGSASAASVQQRHFHATSAVENAAKRRDNPGRGGCRLTPRSCTSGRWCSGRAAGTQAGSCPAQGKGGVLEPRRQWKHRAKAESSPRRQCKHTKQRQTALRSTRTPQTSARLLVQNTEAGMFGLGFRGVGGSAHHLGKQRVRAGPPCRRNASEALKAAEAQGKAAEPKRRFFAPDEPEPDARLTSAVGMPFGEDWKAPIRALPSSVAFASSCRGERQGRRAVC